MQEVMSLRLKGVTTLVSESALYTCQAREAKGWCSIVLGCLGRCTVAPPFRINDVSSLQTLSLILWSTNLLDGVRNIFPVRKEPWSMPGRNIKMT